MTRFAVLLMMISTSLVSAAPMRTWTAKSGKKMKAEFVREANGTVVLKGEDGKEVGIPKARLHEADQRFIYRTVTLKQLETTGKPVTLLEIPPMTWSIAPNGTMLITGKGKLPGSKEATVDVKYTVKKIDTFSMMLEKAKAWCENAIRKKEAADNRALIDEITDERRKDGLRILFYSFADELKNSKNRPSTEELDEFNFLKVYIYAGIPFKDGLTQTGTLYGVMRYSNIEELLKKIYAAPFSELSSKLPEEPVKIPLKKKPVI